MNNRLVASNGFWVPKWACALCPTAVCWQSESATLFHTVSKQTLWLEGDSLPKNSPSLLQLTEALLTPCNQSGVSETGGCGGFLDFQRRSISARTHQQTSAQRKHATLLTKCFMQNTQHNVLMTSYHELGMHKWKLRHSGAFKNFFLFYATFVPLSFCITLALLPERGKSGAKIWNDTEQTMSEFQLFSLAVLLRVPKKL